MDKMKMETANQTLDNLAKLKEMFPEVITESKDENGEIVAAVDAKKLEQLLSTKVIEGDESYDFTWVGKKQAMIEACKPIRKTLRPCREESVDWENTQNLYIEGDNLDVLKLLQESYLNKVKMIYIDPPYNTGNDSFIYPDDYSTNKDAYDEEVGAIDESGYRMFKNTETNGRFHSSWCSMMYPRLKLARNLLSEDGVIFISIDDNEVDNMRKMCDEVFGKDNFRNQLLVRRRIKSLNVQFAENGLNSFNVAFEYVLVYSKNKEFLFKPLRLTKSQFSEKGSWNVFWSNADRPSMRYDILGFTPKTGQWRWQKELAEEAVQNYKNYEQNFSNISLEDYWRNTGEKLRFIRRIPNATGKNGGVQYWVGPQETSLRTSNWTDIEVSQIAKEFDIPFDNPKNINLMVEFVKSLFNDDFIILDFFSGSATTAHAVMQLNAEDGGKRKFIMVQLPEICDEKSEAYKAGYKNICEIGKERIRRAGKKIVEESGKIDLDIGFRVLKLDDGNMKDVYYTPEEYNQKDLVDMASNIKDDRTPEDLLYACMLEWGLELSLPHKVQTIAGYNVHIVDDGALVACFDDRISEDAIKQIAELQPLRAVFRDSGFAGDAARVNVGEIFKLKSPNTTIKVL